MLNPLSISLIVSTILLSSVVVLLIRALDSLKKSLLEEMRRNYEVQIDWISYSKQKLRFLRVIGITFSIEEAFLDFHENSVMDSYANSPLKINKSLNEEIQQCLNKHKK